MKNLNKYSIELDTYCKELKEKYDFNKKKLDTYEIAGKCTEENAPQDVQKSNYEIDIYDVCG